MYHLNPTRIAFVHKGLSFLAGRTLQLLPVIALLSASLLHAADPTPAAVPPPQTPTPAPAAVPETEAEKAWKELEQARRSASRPPADLNRTNAAAMAEWRARRGSEAVKLADRIEAFRAKYPNDPHLLTASQFELEALRLAKATGPTNLLSRLIAAEDRMLALPQASVDDRYRIKQDRLDRLTSGIRATNRSAYIQVMREETRKLMKEFPTRKDHLSMLMLAVVDTAPHLEALEIAREISSLSTGRVKMSSDRVIARLERIGKPFSLVTTNIDGVELSLEKLKGKVVVIDIGASWSSPWQKNLGALEEAYKSLHDKGLEVIGISLDSDRKRLREYLTKRSIPWTYACDGESYKGPLAQQLLVSNVPARWLVDRKGILRDINAKEDLKASLEKLIQEAP